MAHRSAALEFLRKEAVEYNDDTHQRSVHFLDFPNEESGFRVHRHLPLEHWRALCARVEQDHRLGVPCEVHEVFRFAQHPHLCLDVDAKPALPAGQSAETVAAALGAVVKTAVSAKMAQRSAGMLDALVLAASRPGKASFHVHYYKLRMPFERQLELAKYLKEALRKSPALAWLGEALDLTPNTNGALRMPFTSKWDADEKRWIFGSTLTFAGVFQHDGTDVSSDTAPHRKRNPFLALADQHDRAVAIMMSCLHGREVDKQLDVILEYQSTGIEFRKYINAERELLRDEAARPAPPVPAPGAELMEDVVQLDMMDWSTLATFGWQQDLARRLRDEPYPYTETIKWFARFVTIIGDRVRVKSRDEQGALQLASPFSVGTAAQTLPLVRREALSGKFVEATFISLFLRSVVRAHYSTTTYLPWGPEERRPDPGTALNTYTGFLAHRVAAEPRVCWETEALLAVPGPVQRVLEHIQRDLCAGRWDFAEAIICFCAHIVQTPSVITERFVLMHGCEGSGKSRFWIEFMCRRIIGFSCAIGISDPEQAIGTFNYLLSGKSLVVLDEALFSDPRTADRMKNLVTMKSLSINRKFHDQQVCPNFMNIVVVSNHDVPIGIGVDARRPIAIRTSDATVAMDAEAKARYHADLSDLFSDPEAVRQFSLYLLDIDLDAAGWSRDRFSRQYYSADLQRMKTASNREHRMIVAMLTSRRIPGLYSGAVAPGVADPDCPTWLLQTDEESCLRALFSEFGTKYFTKEHIKQQLAFHGCRFDGSTVQLPRYADFLESFRKVMPRFDPDAQYSERNLDCSQAAVEAREDDVNALHVLRRLPFKSERRAREAREMEQRRRAAEELARVPITPPRKRIRRRVVEDDDVPPATPPPFTSPSRARAAPPRVGPPTPPRAPLHLLPEDEAEEQVETVLGRRRRSPGSPAERATPARQ